MFASSRGLKIGIRIALGLFAVVFLLVLLLKLFWMEENWRGRRDLTRYEAELRSRGEKLDVESFIPPPVPEEHNFAMAPLLAPIWKAPRDELNKKPKPPGSPLERLERVDLNIAGAPTMGAGDLETGRRLDWAAWARYFQKEKQQTSMDELQTGRAVVDWLGRWSQELDEFSAAADRPYARFPIDYQKGIAIQIPHIKYMVSFTRVFWLRANAALAAGDSSSAIRDLHTLDRVHSGLRSEPMLISYLVRNVTIRLLLQVVWQGCVDHRWNKDQLDSIGAMLAPIDLLADYARVLRGERALSNVTFDTFRASRRSPNSIISEYFSWAGIPGNITMFAWLPNKAVMYQNQLSNERWVQDHQLPVVDVVARRIYPERQKDGLRVNHEMKTTFYNLLVKAFANSTSSTSLRTATAQVAVDEARTACAIERFRLSAGNIPTSLNELVPNYLAGIPSDIIGGLPLRYCLESDGNYRLYSVGWNEVDDGGTIAKKPDGKLGRDNENGDWVWFGAVQK